MAFRGRNPQIVACCECKLVVHRTCLPENLTSTDYVRMKKYKEAFEFKCVKCFARHHGCTSPSVVTRKRKATNSTEPSSKRQRQVPEPIPPSVARTRPTAIVPSSRLESVARTRPSAIVLSSRQETVQTVVVTFTPLDPLVSPILPILPSLSVSVGMSLNFVITPSDHEQLVDWSSRYDIPIPLREDTVELRQLAIAPALVAPVAPLVPYDSSDDEDVVDKPYNWHILDSALRK